tara:strand:+ start:1747 stop:4212 length:2466 start_codon:yes stop_codon:yes gene_type:complete
MGIKVKGKNFFSSYIRNLKSRNISIFDIIAELVTNAYEHGKSKSSKKRKTRIEINFKEKNITISDIGSGMNQEDFQRFANRGREEGQAEKQGLEQRGFFGDGANISGHISKNQIKTKKEGFKGIVGELDAFKNKYAEYEYDVREMTQEEEKAFLSELGSTSGTQVKLSDIKDNKSDTKASNSLFTKEFEQELTEKIKKDFRYNQAHLDNNHELLINGNEIIAEKSIKFKSGTKEEYDLELANIYDTKIQKLLKDQGININDLPSAKLIIGERENYDYNAPDLDIDKSVHTRQFGVRVNGKNAKMNETLANIIANPKKELENVQNEVYTHGISGELTFDHLFLKACQHASDIEDDFLDINRTKFGENKNQYAKNILTFVGDIYANKVSKIRKREEGSLKTSSEDLSMIQRKLMDLDKEILGEDNPGSLKPINNVEFRPPTINVAPGEVGRITMFINEEFLEQLKNGHEKALFVSQAVSKDASIVDIVRNDYTEGIKKELKYLMYSDSKYEGYKKVSIPVIGNDIGISIITINFEKEDSSVVKESFSVNVVEKSTIDIPEDRLTFLNHRYSVRKGNTKKIRLAIGEKVWDDDDISKMQLNSSSEELKISEDSLNKVKDVNEYYPDDSIGQYGANVIDINVIASKDFESATITATLPTKNVIVAIVDGKPIRKDFELEDKCYVSALKGPVPMPELKIYNKKEIDDDKKLQKLMKEGPVSLESAIDENPDMYKAFSTHPIFKDTVKFGKKGEILDEDSNEFYEVLASELASIKSTKVGLEKIEKQTIGQTDQLDKFRKEYILRDTYIKYRKIWKIYARHKKNGIK